MKKKYFFSLFMACTIAIGTVNVYLNSQNESSGVTLFNLEALSQNLEEVEDTPIVFCLMGSETTHWGHCVGSTQTFGFACILEGAKDCHGTYLSWL